MTLQMKTIVTIECNVCHRKTDTEYETATEEWGVSLQIIHTEFDAEQAGWRIDSKADKHVCPDCQTKSVDENVQQKEVKP